MGCSNTEKMAEKLEQKLSSAFVAGDGRKMNGNGREFSADTQIFVKFTKVSRFCKANDVVSQENGDRIAANQFELSNQRIGK